jgi:hypothetical protein
MTAEATRVLGTPVHFATLEHQDGAPLCEVGFTTDGAFATVIVRNTRTNTWQQAPLETAAAVAVMVLVGGASTDNTATFMGIRRAIRQLKPEDLDRLGLVVAEIKVMARDRLRDIPDPSQQRLFQPEGKAS